MNLNRKVNRSFILIKFSAIKSICTAENPENQTGSDFTAVTQKQERNLLESGFVFQSRSSVFTFKNSQS